MTAHPGEHLDRDPHRTDCSGHSSSRSGAGRSLGGEGAGDCAREQQRPDEVTAAAVVLLRGRLTGFVRADRDVLGPVV